MTDRELLEFAAKAAGLRINFHPTASYQWNPLERDDDALRSIAALATHSHHHRAQLANLMRNRGHTVKADLTKTYRRTA